jgi:GT2 family glycosyltransferase
MTSTPRVATIILNWKGWKDTVECLESLYRIDYDNYEVIVLDNGSPDDSVDRIKAYCDGKLWVESKFFDYDSSNRPIQIIEMDRKEVENGTFAAREIAFQGSAPNRRLRLILSEKNLGFAEGCNLCMRYAIEVLDSDTILLLNNDTIVDCNFLTQLIRVSQESEKIGIVGPKIYFYEKNGRTDVINCVGGVHNLGRGRVELVGWDEVDRGQHDEERKNFDLISGCCMLIKKEVIRKIGFFDPVYFVSWEDSDYCKRASAAGYMLVYVPRSVIWHKGGRSYVASIGAYYFGRNGFIFVKKFGSRSQFSHYIAYQFLYGGLMSAFPFLVVQRDFNGFVQYFRGMLGGLVTALNS